MSLFLTWTTGKLGNKVLSKWPAGLRPEDLSLPQIIRQGVGLLVNCTTNISEESLDGEGASGEQSVPVDSTTLEICVVSSGVGTQSLPSEFLEQILNNITKDSSSDDEEIDRLLCDGLRGRQPIR